MADKIFIVISSGAWAGEDNTAVLLATKDEGKAIEAVRSACDEYDVKVEHDDDAYYVGDYNSRGGNLSIHKEELDE
jgi:hypothetical protein